MVFIISIPLDAKQVGKLSEKYGVTVLLGTPTFLRGYLRRVKPEQFSKLDVVVVGAEKMPGELFAALKTSSVCDQWKVMVQRN